MIDTLLKRLLQFPTQFFLLLIGALLFLPQLGSVHLLDWDEINFAESAREMLLTGNWRMVQIDFQPFYEKPPLFIWLQALSMHYLGVGELAARLPNAVCGMATMLVVFNIGRMLFNSQFGVLWALLFACSMTPQLHFKSGIIDPVFNLFIFLGIHFMYKVSIVNDFESQKTRIGKARLHLLLSALFIGLATLTKGPVAILLTVLTAVVYFIVNRGKLRLEITELLIWGLGISAVVVVWLSFEIRANGIHFIDEFITYQIRLLTTPDAGHGGPFYFHFIVLFIGVFPASCLIFDSFRKNTHDDFAQTSYRRWMTYLLCVTLVVFSIVKTKIIHYSSLCYFPITFLAAYYLHQLFEKRMTWSWRQTVPLFTLTVSFAVALTAGVILIQTPEKFTPYIKDVFAVANLQAQVHWSSFDLIFGLGLLVSISAALLLMQQRHYKWGTYVILISSGMFVKSAMTFIIPRVEQYTQHAFIDFLEEKSKENCVVEVAEFKSYAHLFYARKPIPSAADAGKKHYVVTRLDRLDRLHKNRNDLQELYRKNGWVFFEKVNQ